MSRTEGIKVRGRTADGLEMAARGDRHARDEGNA